MSNIRSQYSPEELKIRELEKQILISSLKGEYDGKSIEYFVDDYFNIRDEIIEIKNRLKVIESKHL